MPELPSSSSVQATPGDATPLTSAAGVTHDVDGSPVPGQAEAEVSDDRSSEATTAEGDKALVLEVPQPADEAPPTQEQHSDACFGGAAAAVGRSMDRVESIVAVQTIVIPSGALTPRMHVSAPTGYSVQVSPSVYPPTSPVVQGIATSAFPRSVTPTFAHQVRPQSPQRFYSMGYTGTSLPVQVLPATTVVAPAVTTLIAPITTAIAPAVTTAITRLAAASPSLTQRCAPGASAYPGGSGSYMATPPVSYLTAPVWTAMATTPRTPAPPMIVQRFVSTPVVPLGRSPMPVRQISTASALATMPVVSVLLTPVPGRSLPAAAPTIRSAPRFGDASTMVAGQDGMQLASSSKAAPLLNGEEEEEKLKQRYHTHKGFEATVFREKKAWDSRMTIDGEGELRKTIEQEMGLESSRRSSASARPRGPTSQGFIHRDSSPGGSMPAPELTALREAEADLRYTPQAEVESRFRASLREHGPATPTTPSGRRLSGAFRDVLEGGQAEVQGSPGRRGSAFRT